MRNEKKFASCIIHSIHAQKEGVVILAVIKMCSTRVSDGSAVLTVSWDNFAVSRYLL